MEKRLILIILIGFGVVLLCNPVSSTDIIAPIAINADGYYRLMNDVSNSPGDCIVIRGSNIVLDGNGHTISGNGQNSGVLVTGNGLVNVTVKNINAYQFANGISIIGSQGTGEHQITYSTIDNCKLNNNNNGIYLDATHDFAITNNEIENNLNSGIEPGNYAIGELLIYHNLIKGNQNYGINFFSQTWGSGGMVIINNEISNSNTGVILGTVHKLNIIQENKIQNNNIGLSISSSGSTIVNNLFDNTINIVSDSGTNIWNMPLKIGPNIIDGPFIGGNAWLQPNGLGFSQITPESNIEGICNSPYDIKPGNTDNYPLYLQVTPTPTPTTPIPTVTITPTPSPTTIPNYSSISLSPGWNFISTPKTLAAGYNTGAIFSQVDMGGHSAFMWDGSQNPPRWNTVQANTPIQPLYGVWIYSISGTNVNLNFDTTNPMFVPAPRSLSEGWNSIGFTGLYPTSARNTYLSVQPNWTHSMGFNAITQSYQQTIFNGDPSESTILYPTKGYWLYMRSPGSLAAIGA